MCLSLGLSEREKKRSCLVCFELYFDYYHGNAYMPLDDEIHNAIGSAMEESKLSSASAEEDWNPFTAAPQQVLRHIFFLQSLAEHLIAAHRLQHEAPRDQAAADRIYTKGLACSELALLELSILRDVRGEYSIARDLLDMRPVSDETEPWNPFGVPAPRVLRYILRLLPLATTITNQLDGMWSLRHEDGMQDVIARLSERETAFNRWLIMHTNICSDMHGTPHIDDMW